MILFDTRALLVSAFNQRRGTNHAISDVEFGIPFSIAELPIGTATVDNTCIRLRAGGFEETFTYRRLGVLEPMQQFSTNWTPLKMQNGDTFTAGIAKSISAHYGYPMYPEDILEDGTTVSGNILTLKISNRSVQWLPGQYTITLDGDHVRIGKRVGKIVIPTRVEPEWWYEDRVELAYVTDAIPRADLLTYGNDYTPIAHMLLKLKANSDSQALFYSIRDRLTLLARALTSVDSLPWSGLVQTSSPTAFTLPYTWCSYNGPTADITPEYANKRNVPAHQLIHLLPVNTNYERVAVLRPNSNPYPYYNTGFSPDTMLLHYNIEV